ncbi:MAG: hypothetical protein H6718_29905 [Polyangiaceae bacterium]|nr:hypothetical protein [Myxococcales bacterium]MCB9589666.1 hypothetical protein [Polyangiaceae bacterium]
MLRTFLPLACVLVCAACASSPGLPPPIAANQLGATGPVELPILLVFEAGESVPLDVTTHGDVVALKSDGGAKLVAKRKLWLLITEDSPPRLSLDGEHFDQVHGAFSFGFGVTKQRGSFATMELKLASQKP